MTWTSSMDEQSPIPPGVSHSRASAWLIAGAFVAWALLVQGCASSPTLTVPSSPHVVTRPAIGSIGFPLPAPQPMPGVGFSLGGEIVVRAISLLGTPYQFGGNGPEAFDCSGLVRYIYNELGIDVPRTAIEQYRAAMAVDMDHVEPGDLLFFRTRGRGVSHVAIYAGSGRFVHAPQTGRVIELREIGDGYYRTRLVGAGRLK